MKQLYSILRSTNEASFAGLVCGRSPKMSAYTVPASPKWTQHVIFIEPAFLALAQIVFHLHQGYHHLFADLPKPPRFLLMAPSSDLSDGQPDHEFSLQEFHTLVKESSLEGQSQCAENNKFCPESILREYLGENKRYRLTKLLKDLYRNGSTLAPDYWINEAENILDNENGYVLVLATLLSIGLGQFFEYFYRHRGLSDRALPFTSMPDSFPDGPRKDEFFKRFKDAQWQFCAARMDSRRDTIWERERILPITEKIPIGSGGSGDTFRIKIHPSYNGIDLGSKPTHRVNVLCYPDSLSLKEADFFTLY